MYNTLNTRNWRYATKKYDASKTVPQATLETLLEAIRLSASSYGLQPYHIFVISDPALKQQLRPVSWNQSQIEEASHLLVFANVVNFDESLIDNYIKNTATTRNIPLENLKGYADFMKSQLVGLSPDAKNEWATKQVYLALGNALQATAELALDSTPIEGFVAEEYNKILDLTAKGLNAVVVLAVGYRSPEDETQHLAKVRYPKEKMFTHL